MTTTKATPSALFTEEELNTIFGEISWELDILGDERRGGNEESAKDETKSLLATIPGEITVSIVFGGLGIVGYVIYGISRVDEPEVILLDKD